MSSHNVLRLWADALRYKEPVDVGSADTLRFRPYPWGASDYIDIDIANKLVTLTAGVSISGQGSTLLPMVPAAAQQTLAAGGGAVTITEFYTAGASDAGGDAWTLADGAQKGQLKKIQLITDGGGDAVLTPTSLSGGTTITFADAGDYAILMWNGSDWVPIELGNSADGATAPVLA